MLDTAPSPTGFLHNDGECAKLIAAITKKPYSVKAYKYVCPEVASVLRNTEKVLGAAWAD